MNLMTDALQKGQTARLREALGIEIRVTAGRLWLTQERDAQDHVIETGGSFRIDHAGAVILTALGRETCAWSWCPAPHRLAPLRPAVGF